MSIKTIGSNTYLHHVTEEQYMSMKTIGSNSYPHHVAEPGNILWHGSGNQLCRENTSQLLPNT